MTIDKNSYGVDGMIFLVCPDCKRAMEVKRDESDYPEAVRVEVRCDECDDGDFSEVCQYDANGKHITRDPTIPLDDQP